MARGFVELRLRRRKRIRHEALLSLGFPPDAPGLFGFPRPPGLVHFPDSFLVSGEAVHAVVPEAVPEVVPVLAGSIWLLMRVQRSTKTLFVHWPIPVYGSKFGSFCEAESEIRPSCLAFV